MLWSSGAGSGSAFGELIVRDPVIFGGPRSGGPKCLPGRLGCTIVWEAVNAILRPPTQGEVDFLKEYFGDQVDGWWFLVIREAPIGDRPHVGPNLRNPFWPHAIYFPKEYFVGNDAENELDLADPEVRASLAHESTHLWQRHFTGMVWARSLLERLFLGDGAYSIIQNPSQMSSAELLERWMGMGVESQAEQYEDFVRKSEAGQDVTVYWRVTNCVKGSALDCFDF